MSTYVLVHGAWQSTGTWDLIVPLLTTRGQKTLTPVLTGLGTDAQHLSGEVTLQQHINDVSNSLAQESNVILVGHSYAGMIVSGVAEKHPDKIQRLVFLDAFVPENGNSVLDLLPPETGNYFRDLANKHGDGWRLPGGEGHLDLWGLQPGEAREFVRERLSDFSLRCFEEQLALPANHKAKLPATFVSCVADNYPAKPFFRPFAEKARLSGWDVREVNTGHDCHVERPAEVAEILLAGAKSH